MEVSFETIHAALLAVFDGQKLSDGSCLTASDQVEHLSARAFPHLLISRQSSFEATHWAAFEHHITWTIPAQLKVQAQEGSGKTAIHRALRDLLVLLHNYAGLPVDEDGKLHGYSFPETARRLHLGELSDMVNRRGPLLVSGAITEEGGFATADLTFLIEFIDDVDPSTYPLLTQVNLNTAHALRHYLPDETQATIAFIRAGGGGSGTSSAAVTTDTTIYVDETNGSDSNLGTTESAAVQTLGRAVTLSTGRRKRHIVLLTDLSAANFPTTLTIPSGWGPDTEPLTIIGSISEHALGTRTATGGTSATSIVDSTLALTSEQLTGYYVRMLTGTAAGLRAQIGSHTATALSVKTALTGASSGDTFQIESPGKIINYSASATWTITGPGLATAGVKFRNQGATTIFILIGSTFYPSFSDFDLNSSGILRAGIGNRFLGGTTTYPVDVSDYLDGSFAGVGIYVFNGSRFDASGFGADLTLQGSTIRNITTQAGVLAGGQFSLSACEFYQSRIRIQNGGRIVSGALGGINCISRSANGVGIRIDEDSRGLLTGFAVNSATSHAVQLQNNAWANIFDVTGSGNGGIGIKCESSSRAILSASTTTVTGSSPGVNDVQVGGAAVQSYASIAPYVLDAATGVHVQRV